jgi:hypothetical protein
MPTEEAGYTYAVVPTAIDRLLANEEESIYGPSARPGRRQSSAYSVEKLEKNGELFSAKNKSILNFS